ncbi:response regulator transcription factor [Cellulomonas sp. zg-ZUI222]|uniref:Response regulator transcription factor n=1 Tax=Cellulomonas wangleii TaxID=2816956 RepID=A0ABX8D7V2_9CELL|nr:MULTISPECIES: response regulator transcription factor [Cellulomonas]MBO0900916.1 response regulator transcription factor [Cellulomonas sp. zg-ZUI22]MBO0921571.1 response regulator transcription factor [Cellulomonas wangleii]MBO0925067.1 response regulator transcription factor [Cellulomonas wangleii]QVI63519.1 response regulator transcription factor [Cellulomonas wangleii]
MRVLVVDDEVGLVHALRRGLTAEGFAVDAAHDGATGLAMAVDGAYDVLVVDVMLPRRNGYEVVTALRAQDVWTPVLMLSAKDGEHDVADGLDVGADDYLTKPFSFVVLVARLRALVRRPVAPRPAVLQAGALTLDPASREVTRDGRPVGLTVRETALLEYLLRHADRVVGKIELLDHVFDTGGEDPNVVEVYVGYLRRKLGRDAVTTVRGAGYRVGGA